MQWQYFSTNLYMHDARQYPMPLLEFEELSFCRDMPLRTDACLHHTSPSAVFFWKWPHASETHNQRRTNERTRFGRGEGKPRPTEGLRE